HATQGISVLISETGLVNVDFADVRTVMSNGGSALMGTGVGRGENRALEAAQQAIASPLLDNVSISGATGVLVNITGGEDLTLGEVHQINEVVHEAVGGDAEIIFGAVHEPAMQGEIRVTVIATGFDRHLQGGTQPGNGAYTNGHTSGHSNFGQSTGLAGHGIAAGAKTRTVLPFPDRERPVVKPPATGTRPAWEAAPVTRSIPRPPATSSQPSPTELDDMEIPTFIRRQMD
ncbi:MAG: cell division protein FtsZ, partial [Gemmatimonadaceae bacterium]